MTKLTDATVRSTTKPGLHADGGGLYLSVAPTKRNGVWCKSWVLRYSAASGKRRSMGLGAYPEVKLAAARRQASVLRDAARNGRDPIEAKREARRAARLEEARNITFKQCAEAFIEAHKASWRSDKHRQQWPSTLQTYVYPVLGDLPVGDVSAALVIKVLDPIWTAKNETASRIRGRIEAILDWARARGHRDGENPARWKGHLQYALPARRKISSIQHHAAMPFDEIGAFIRQLRAMDGVSARALEFVILTAARTNEAIGARWEEIDLDAKVWAIPAARMKGGREHRVPLSNRAVDILRHLSRESDYVFCAGPDAGRLSNMALLMTLRRMKRPDITVHGFRSTFRDWAAERTNFAREVAEAALAHSIGDRVEAAYRRGDLFEKRRSLMNAWALYCEAQIAKSDSDVIDLVLCKNPLSVMEQRRRLRSGR